MPLINCSNVSITDSVLFRSNGSGLSLLDTTGAVNTSIAESYIQSQVSNTMYGGNGFAVEFTANVGRFKATGVVVRQSATFNEGVFSPDVDRCT